MKLSLLSGCVFFFSVFVFLVPETNAATLYIDPNETHSFRADSVTLSVRIDTDEGECINTVDAVVSYDPSIAAVDVSRGDSILTLWVEDPVIDQEAHTITFAGGIPNGYCGRVPGDPRLTNVIAKLVFQVPGFSVGGGGNSKVAEVSFAPETRVMLNDGYGTEAPLKTFGAKIALDDNAGSAITDGWGATVAADDIPPSPFSIELVQNSEVFSGKYYIVFSTTDKQSGIDHYEVYEEPIEELSLFRWGVPDTAWVEAKNPYVLVDQDMKSVIRVKAIDKAGNERIAIYAPEETSRIMDPRTLITVLVSALLALALVTLFAFFIRKRLAKKDVQ